MDIHIPSINRVIKILIMSDLLLFFGFGLLTPIFAVFIMKSIEGGSLAVVGFATTCYWLARVLTTIPLSRFMDKTHGERDEYYCVLIGSVVMAILPLFFAVSSLPWHIYLIEIISGIANSLAVPAWRILFTNHLDKGKTGYEWSVEDIAVGVAVAFSASVGAFVADRLGFTALFVCMAIIGLTGALILIPLYKNTMTLRQMRQYHKEKFGPPLKVDTIK